MLFLRQNKRVLMATATVSLLLVILLGSCYLYKGHPHYKTNGAASPLASYFVSTTEGSPSDSHSVLPPPTQNSSSKSSGSALSQLIQHLFPTESPDGSTSAITTEHSGSTSYSPPTEETFQPLNIGSIIRDIMNDTQQHNDSTDEPNHPHSPPTEDMFKPLDLGSIIRDILNDTQQHNDSTEGPYGPQEDNLNGFLNTVSEILNSANETILNQTEGGLSIEESDDATHSSHADDDSAVEILLIDDSSEQPEDGKKGVMTMDDTGTSNVNVESSDTVHVVKVVTVNRVEEVFEDLLNQNVHRIIKEDREERTEFLQNGVYDGSESDLDLKNIVSN